MALNDLLQLLGVGGRNVTGREYSPEIMAEINKMTPLTSAGREARVSNQPTTNQSESESQGGGGFLSSLAGIIEGMAAGARGDPYGPANQKRDQMKMGVALQTAKREAEESKLRHRLLQLTVEKEESEEQLKKTPIGNLLTQETESTPLPEYNPNVSPGTGPTQPGATEEKPTGKYKLNITQGTPVAVINLLKGLLGEEAVNRQLGIGKPERVTTKEGETVSEKTPGGDWKTILSGGTKKEKPKIVQYQDATGEPKWLSEGDPIPKGWKPYKAPTEKPPVYDVIENKKGEQAYIEKGSNIPPGWRVAKGSETSVNINLEKSTKGAVEKDIVEKGEALQTLRDTEKAFKDDYLTWPGEARAWGERISEKAGITKGSKWLSDRQEWYQGAKENLLKFRKFITGVAGGEKEFDEIASAAPDPDRNSPTTFKANLRKSKINTIKLIKRWQAVLNLTGKEPTKDQLSTISLANIKVEPWELGEDNPEETLKGKGLVK
jgi:hypothetical protein